MIDELVLAERLIGYETSRSDVLVAAAGFVKGWLESRDIEVRDRDHNGFPVLIADAGATRDEAPTVVFHGHLDVVPGQPEQFQARIDGDRLIGRGAYDMKGGLAAMMCALKDLQSQDAVRVRLVCVPDEESEEIDERSTDAIVAAGLGGQFAITGEPTNMHIGVEAKGVLAMRIVVHGRAAHSSTPWLGDNAVLKAVDVFRAIESLPFTRESSEMFDRPSINLGRIAGGDALNKVPDRCEMAVDVRYLPGQDPGEILEQVRAIPEIDVTRTFLHPPVTVSRTDPFVQGLREAVSRTTRGEVMSVGRDGASDAASFIEAGIPAVEFGPAGGGHHGPDEWVSMSSLQRYRRALGEFVRALPAWLAQAPDGPTALRAVEGGRP
ncbi:MAG TPA: M20/M25/M40 family metallo-hydrolase [Solirubrobacteraceae bacterium]|jgi:succinyl-diaminopimelate desuccinylase|nr:M20/M25/M40 family metallo-hydrolase [Solirubrobacteraceae bacterium]